MTHRTPAQEMRRDLALLFGIPAVILIALIVWLVPWPKSYELPDGVDLYATVAGTWTWSGEDGGCEDPHLITFDDDRSVMRIVQAEPWTDSSGVPKQVSIYDIEEIDGTIRGKIRGETRLDDDGIPVVWDLVLTSEHTYRWERADWASLMGGTEEIERCAGGITARYQAAFADTARAPAAFAAAQAFADSSAGEPVRIFAVAGGTRHYLATDVRDPEESAVHLAILDEAGPRWGFSYDRAGATRFAVRSLKLEGRTIVLVEPMAKAVSLGVQILEIRNDSLQLFDVFPFAWPTADGPGAVIDSLTVRVDSGRVAVEADGDLVIFPGTTDEGRLCQVSTFLPIRLVEGTKEWSFLQATRAESCDR